MLERDIRFLLYFVFVTALLAALVAIFRVSAEETRPALLTGTALGVGLGVLGSFWMARRMVREERAEAQRLARRTRDLHDLHDVGLALGSASQPAAVLSKVTQAALRLAAARHAAVVAQPTASDPPEWATAGEPPLADSRRREIERHLADARRPAPQGPVERLLPEAATAVPIVQGQALFGWIFLWGPAPTIETRDMLEILAGQLAVTLRSLHLLQERLQSERFTTAGKMISTMVHDFRNPLTAIKGYAGLIEDSDLEPERRQDCAHLIVEETDRMAAMIDELLEFARGASSPLKLRPIAVTELTAKLRRLIEPELHDRGVEFETDLGYAGPLCVDVDRMMRALLNVASNALAATDAGGVLSLRTREDDGEVEVALADTGRGIPEELQPRVFEPFFTYGKPKGIGLGLAIARKIVEEHGGRIAVASKPGAGTTFTIRLPLPRG